MKIMLYFNIISYITWISLDCNLMLNEQKSIEKVNIIPIYTNFLITVAGIRIKCEHGENKHGGAKVVINAFEQET